MEMTTPYLMGQIKGAGVNESTGHPIGAPSGDKGHIPGAEDRFEVKQVTGLCLNLFSAVPGWISLSLCTVGPP